MKRKDQKPMETLEPQILESLEEHQDKNCVTRSYRAPQVFLVGKAKRLIAFNYSGRYGDGHQGWTYNY